MGPVSDTIVSTFGDTILVEMGMHVGFDLTAKAANDLVFDGAIKQIVPIHSSRLETTGVKTMTITLKYKHVPEDASLGFYRSGVHQCVCPLPPCSVLFLSSRLPGSRSAQRSRGRVLVSAAGGRCVPPPLPLRAARRA